MHLVYLLGTGNEPGTVDREKTQNRSQVTVCVQDREYPTDDLRRGFQ